MNGVGDISIDIFSVAQMTQGNLISNILELFSMVLYGTPQPYLDAASEHLWETLLILIN